MRRIPAVVCIAFLIVLAFSSSPARAQQVEPARTWLIEPNGSIPGGELVDLVTAAGGTLLRVHDEIMIAVALSDDPDFGANLETSQKIRLVTRDLLTQWRPKGARWGTRIMQGPDDEAAGAALDPTNAFFYPCQWNLAQIDAPGAWAQGVFGDPGVKVAVLDSGIDPSHLDLAGHVDLANSTSMLTPGSSPCNYYLGLPDEETYLDFEAHGTFVSALIAGNGIGMAAMPGCPSPGRVR